MATRLIDWTLAHLRLMWLFVGVTFVVMLFIPDARWNAITTVWGALFVGLLISLVLEQRGEGIQRRIWLAQHADRAKTAVDELLAVAAQSAVFAVDLPDEIMQALTSGATRTVRREAAERARAHIASQVAVMQLAPVSPDNDHQAADDLLGHARQASDLRERLHGVRNRHRTVLSRVAPLDTALDRFLDALRWYEKAVDARDNSSDEGALATRAAYERWAGWFFLRPIGEAAVGLCEACADLLVEARLLSS